MERIEPKSSNRHARPDSPGFNALSKTYLYAGGRALLVSHWPVVSAAATKITTQPFEKTAGTAEIGRAVALAGKRSPNSTALQN